MLKAGGRPPIELDRDAVHPAWLTGSGVLLRLARFSMFSRVYAEILRVEADPRCKKKKTKIYVCTCLNFTEFRYADVTMARRIGATYQPRHQR